MKTIKKNTISEQKSNVVERRESGRQMKKT